MKYIVYKIIVFIVRPLFKIVYRPTVIGSSNIPALGPTIIASNHKSQLDAASMLYTPKRVVHVLGKKELFKSKIGSLFFRSMAVIPVDRSVKDENAKSSSLNILKNGNVIGIFPEGTTNKTIGTENEVDLLPFKFGAVSFALKSQAKIVPMAICGEYKIFKKNLLIIYGEPYEVKGDLVQENRILESKIRNLKKKGDEIIEERRK